MAYRPYEGTVSIVPVTKEGNTILYVNKAARKHGNEFAMPSEIDELIELIVKSAKGIKGKVLIACNTTQTEGKGAKNTHTVKDFLAKAEQFEVVVSSYGWSPYLAFNPGPGQMVGRERKPVELTPGAIRR